MTIMFESICSIRRCKHFLGIKTFEPDPEINKKHVCEAYPEGIPVNILSGDDMHSSVREDQKNKIVFEEK